ncbi:MAG: hypothetical protein H0X17_14870, partial [Deltaproteobacteria bacterium]|nr:hypothetical protein [Deltaproteobacteria bacterium]
MKITQIRTIVGALVALSSTMIACTRGTGDDSSFIGPRLGESTASPGSNPSKSAPRPSDAPERMNVSMAIRAPGNPEVAPPKANATAPAANAPRDARRATGQP